MSDEVLVAVRYSLDELLRIPTLVSHVNGERGLTCNNLRHCQWYHRQC